MKPSSIVFLILSVVLILSGLSLCSMAKSMAKDADYALFMQEENEDGDLVTTFDIDPESVTNLSIFASGADVSIVTGAEKPHIALINYQINTFTYKNSGGTLSISDDVSLLTLFNLSGQGTQFRGLRYYFSKQPAASAEKSIVIYLNDDIELGEVNITSNNGDITVKKCQSIQHYKLQASQGNILVQGATSATQADLITTGKGNITVRDSLITKINANVANGNCSYIAKEPYIQTYEVNTEDGKVLVDGIESTQNGGKTYTHTSVACTVTCTISVTKGDVMVTELID